MRSRRRRRPRAARCCSPGFVVMTAMSGMFFMGSQIFASFGVGTVLVVAIALVGSLTVLPAVLSKLGDRVDRGRIPFLARRRAANGDSRFWGAVVHGRDAPSGRLGRGGGRPPGRPRDPRAQPAHGRLGRAGPAARPAGDEGLRARAEDVPRRWRAGGRGRQRERRDAAPGAWRASPPSGAPHSRPARCTSRSASRRAGRTRRPAC